MSRYVISDVHGCYDEFIKMLEKINFQNNDELCILGDIFDRGKEPLKILDYIINRPNISLIRGNHESFFCNYYEMNDSYYWYLNGGKITHEQILLRGDVFEKHLYNYLKSIPLIKIVDKYILVHASLYFDKNYSNKTLEEFLSDQYEQICLWGRDNIGSEKQFKDYTVICGHTPVQAIDKNINNIKDVKIIHRKGTIYIDCGCCYGKESGGRLACLRLDDLKEFYIDKID